MNEVIAKHLSSIVALCIKHHVRRLELFGSATRADFDPARSDHDFLVEFHPIPRRGLDDVYFLLHRDLEALLRRPVDLVEEGCVHNPIIAAAISRQKVPVYAAA